VSIIPDNRFDLNQEFASSGFNSSTKTVSESIPFDVCINDDDCEKLGADNKYACFQYICYPWKDDQDITVDERIPLCRDDDSCKHGKKCFRHLDKRRVTAGLCLNEAKKCGIQNGDATCPDEQKCCGDVCCEMLYFQQYRMLPCLNDEGCQDYGLGQFCCPPNKKDGDNSCCNTNPKIHESATLILDHSQGIEPQSIYIVFFTYIANIHSPIK
jgi:hypothetical protein